MANSYEKTLMAHEREQVARELRRRANRREESVTTPEHVQEVFWCRRIADDIIEGHSELHDPQRDLQEQVEMWRKRCERLTSWFALPPTQRHPLGPEFSANTPDRPAPVGRARLPVGGPSRMLCGCCGTEDVVGFGPCSCGDAACLDEAHDVPVTIWRCQRCGTWTDAEALRAEREAHRDFLTLCWELHRPIAEHWPSRRRSLDDCAQSAGVGVDLLKPVATRLLELEYVIFHDLAVKSYELSQAGEVFVRRIW